MTVQFLRPLADAKQFAEPKILALPVKKRIVKGPTVLWTCFAGHRLVYNRARSALFHIACVLDDATFWLPAYHCRSLVEPFLVAGKAVSFFPVTERLDPDIDYLLRHLSPGDVVTGIRYFGFDCGVRALADLCRDRGCLLIEDLAHAIFARRLYGDLAVTSLAKFYPIKSGGELCFPESSIYEGPLESLRELLPGRAQELARKALRKAYPGVRQIASKEPYRYFKPTEMSRNIRGVDGLLISRQAVGPLVARRRSNYGFLADSLRAASTGRPLFPDLPIDVAPYVFPFLLESESGFTHIRRKRIQIYRWEEMAMSDCEVSQTYRSRLVQLPCHQDLTSEQLECIVSVLR